jgi:hypothetical protein
MEEDGMDERDGWIRGIEGVVCLSTVKGVSRWEMQVFSSSSIDGVSARKISSSCGK